jgi:hypothetical protein
LVDWLIDRVIAWCLQAETTSSLQGCATVLRVLVHVNTKAGKDLNMIEIYSTGNAHDDLLILKDGENLF